MPNSSTPNSDRAATVDLLPYLDTPAPIDVAGNCPQALTSEDAVWIVLSGQVDIFEETATARHHLFRADTGRVLFAPSSMVTSAWIAVGAPQAQLARYSIADFEAALQHPAALPAGVAAIEFWVSQLSRSISPAMPPPGKYSEIDVDQPQAYADGAMLRTSQPVLWLNLTAGQALFGGDAALPAWVAGRLFPLAASSWLETQDDAKIRAVSTQAILAEQSPRQLLKPFHQFLADAWQIQRDHAAQANVERLRTKLGADHIRLQHSFFKLGRSLFSSAFRSHTAGPTVSALHEACRQVAAATGIKFQKTDATASESQTESLRTIARREDFFTRQVILSDQWWRQDHGPLLGFLQENQQPVALLPTCPGRYVMLDPAAGARVPVTKETAARLQEQGHAFYRPFPPRRLGVLDILKYALFGIQRDILTLVIVGLIGALLGLLTPIMTGLVIDSVIPRQAHQELWQIAAILLISVAAVFLFNITRAIAMIRMEGRMDASVQAAMIHRVMGLPLPFFRNYTAGDLANRAMGITRIRQILSGAALTAVLTGIFSLVNLILLFHYDWRMALAALALTLSGAGVAGLLSAYMVRFERRSLDIQGKNAGMVLQLLGGIVKLRMTGTEDRAFGVWADKFAAKKRIDFQCGKLNAALDTLTIVFPVAGSILLFWMFMHQRAPHMGTGQFLAFYTAFSNLQNAMLRVALTLANLLRVVPLYQRAKPILATAPESSESKATPLTLSGDMRADHVTFHYDPEGPLILKDVSLKVGMGEFVALVGGSGSGKSTLMRLFLGFEAPATGAIYYDGRDIQDLDIRDVRQQIGVVLQNGQILPGSIFTNIIGALPLTLDDAWAAARLVGLEADVQTMPMGMHTVLPPGGGTLSGGQRQRLLIARALVRRPRILFLDEATSALDNRTQAVVSESIERLRVTRLVVAHRLSTIIHADRIYAMDKGVIVESGNYSELMAQKGFFYELAKRQIA